MTNEDILRMAREAGWALTGDLYGEQDLIAQIEYFAQLVAAQEREECANACYSIAEYDGYIADMCAEAIKARGEGRTPLRSGQPVADILKGRQ